MKVYLVFLEDCEGFYFDTAYQTFSDAEARVTELVARNSGRYGASWRLVDVK